ncbi:conserved hypothetical protein [Chlamydia pneumoniae LPCoLN]|uniref:hypothetical protein n=1 Tax=Chlamydia pneumoniae TaxID=83558 RepID=UPI0001BD9EAB|nr:hypothetical protein [Chlamydia pneumoniae]ACZ33453.1 conserved hypothetical protein [Chlamydia pneumoniae LPCoLN]
MIDIMQHFKPYTMVPGQKLPIPGSLLYAQVFPTLWRLFSSKHEILNEQTLQVQGPLKRFAVFQDLHRGGLAVTSERYKYYLLPSGECTQSIKGKLPSAAQAGPLLSLGVHKHADWQKVRRRRDLKEILPLWFRFAAMAPKGSYRDLETTAIGSLVKTAHQSVLHRETTEIAPALLSIALAGFSECFLPRSYDEEFQGILPQDGDPEGGVPFELLSYSFGMIQDIFLRHQGQLVEILPALPPEFPCGRLIHVALPNLGTLSIVWTKKTIRQVELHAEYSGEVFLKFCSSLCSARLREWSERRLSGSKRLSLGETLEIKAGTTYLWDCFHK